MATVDLCKKRNEIWFYEITILDVAGPFTPELVRRLMKLVLVKIWMKPSQYK